MNDLLDIARFVLAHILIFAQVIGWFVLDPIREPKPRKPKSRAVPLVQGGRDSILLHLE